MDKETLFKLQDDLGKMCNEHSIKACFIVFETKSGFEGAVKAEDYRSNNVNELYKLITHLLTLGGTRKATYELNRSDDNAPITKLEK